MPINRKWKSDSELCYKGHSFCKNRDQSTGILSLEGCSLIDILLLMGTVEIMENFIIQSIFQLLQLMSLYLRTLLAL